MDFLSANDANLEAVPRHFGEFLEGQVSALGYFWQNRILEIPL